MKNNLSYVSHDVNSHNHWKFKTLRRRMGWAAEGKFWALNNMIAASDGCLLDLKDEDRKSEVAAELDFTVEELDEFITCLLKPCKLLVDVDGKLTNDTVQETLVEVNHTRERKRTWKKEKLTAKNEVSTENNKESPSTIGNVDGENQQSKVKEKKVKESKVKDTGESTIPAVRKVFIPPTVEESREYFLATAGNTKRNGSWPADRCVMESDLFWNSYQGVGWKTNKGAKLVDWKATARKWISNEIKWSAEKASGQKSKWEVPRMPALNVPSGTLIPADGRVIQMLDKTAQELNYLFDKYREDESHCTIISIDTDHYNYLKKSGLISFSPEKTESIRIQAEKTITENNPPVDSTKLNNVMKKIGVLEYFAQLKSTGTEAVFP